VQVRPRGNDRINRAARRHQTSAARSKRARLGDSATRRLGAARRCCGQIEGRYCTEKLHGLHGTSRSDATGCEELVRDFFERHSRYHRRTRCTATVKKQSDVQRSPRSRVSAPFRVNPAVLPCSCRWRPPRRVDRLAFAFKNVALDRSPIPGTVRRRFSALRTHRPGKLRIAVRTLAASGERVEPCTAAIRSARPRHPDRRRVAAGRTGNVRARWPERLELAHSVRTPARRPGLLAQPAIYRRPIREYSKTPDSRRCKTSTARQFQRRAPRRAAADRTA